MDFVHRDDVPYEDAEMIVKALQEKYPGFKVQFVGDASVPGSLAVAALARNFLPAIEIGRWKMARIFPKIGKSMAVLARVPIY